MLVGPQEISHVVNGDGVVLFENGSGYDSTHKGFEETPNELTEASIKLLHCYGQYKFIRFV